MGCNAGVYIVGIDVQSAFVVQTPHPRLHPECKTMSPE